jgi:hypothetical protein
MGANVLWRIMEQGVFAVLGHGSSSHLESFVSPGSNVTPESSVRLYPVLDVVKHHAALTTLGLLDHTSSISQINASWVYSQINTSWV